MCITNSNVNVESKHKKYFEQKNTMNLILKSFDFLQQFSFLRSTGKEYMKRNKIPPKIIKAMRRCFKKSMEMES